MKQYAVLFSLFVTALGQIPELWRSVEKSGFHRELSTSLSIPASLLPNTGSAEEIRCLLLFTETIPTGAYVDPYQIAALKPFGGPDAVVKEKVDIEKPEYVSDPLTVEIRSQLFRAGDVLVSNYSLPVHLRYHAISDTTDFATVTFTLPEVAVRCWNTTTNVPYTGYAGSVTGVKSTNCTSNSQLLCDWSVIETRALCDEELLVPGVTDNLEEVCQQEGITISVPVGRSNYYYLVTYVTLFFTVVGCLLLGCYVINKDFAENEKKVQ